MDVTRTVSEQYKVMLALAGVAAAMIWVWVPTRWRRPALALLVLVSVVNYSRWGFDAWTRRIDAYDLMHYYVNAKYIDELGYLDLYPAMMLVDAEHGGPFFPAARSYMAQDESGHHYAPTQHGVARGKVVRQERFTPERWAAFEHDVLTLQRDYGCRDRDRKKRCIRELSDELWLQLVTDHGFNGTPAWTLIAEPIANVVPVEALKALGYLDVALLAVGLGAVGWAYGGETGLFALLFVAVTYSARWPYVSWVFLRYDWVAALLIATAALKRPGGRWGAAVAGAMAGWASVVRLFPAMWMWGPLWRGLWGLWERQLRRHLLVMAAAFFVAVGVLQGAATARYGTDRVAEHFENMLDHNSAEQLSSRRIGLAMALATEPWKGFEAELAISPETRLLVDEQSTVRYTLAAALAVALGLALRRRSDDEAFAWGFFPFFLITTASYYYYVARITLVVVHAGNLHRPRHRVGLASLFGLEVLTTAISVYAPEWDTANPGKEHRMLLIGALAWGLLAYGLVQMVWMAVEREDAPAEG
jgi:hypothetical protein